MLSTAILKIQNESAAYAAGTTEAGLSEVLPELCREDAALAAAVAQSDKTVKDCAKHLYDHAKEHKQGNSYYMPPSEAARLIRAFYGVDQSDTPPIIAAPVPDNTINILDLL